MRTRFFGFREAGRARRLSQDSLVKKVNRKENNKGGSRGRWCAVPCPCQTHCGRARGSPGGPSSSGGLDPCAPVRRPVGTCGSRLGAEGKRRSEGGGRGERQRKEDVLKSQLCVFRPLSLPHFSEHLTAASLFPGAAGRALRRDPPCGSDSLSDS